MSTFESSLSLSSFLFAEYFVLDLIKKHEETKMFPINRALALQNVGEDGEKGLEQRYLEQEQLLQAMNERIDYVLSKLHEKSQ